MTTIKEALKGITGPIYEIQKSIKALEETKTDDDKIKTQLFKVIDSLKPQITEISNNLIKSVKALKDDDSKEVENIVEQIDYENNKTSFEPIRKTDYYAGPNHYLYLSQQGKAQAQYIWIGGTGLDIRCKTKTLPRVPKYVTDCPKWNYDGSSTGQADGRYSEVWLNPVKMVKDPFRRGGNVLVLCETLDAKTMKPLPTNRRGPAMKIFGNKKVMDEHPWYGIEQEYTMFEADGKTPLGWPKNGFPGPQGPYYCSVGASRAFGRRVVEAHYRACLYCGINISGINAEVMPGQWEFQIGPCEGIDSGDSLWIARYLLERVAEEFNVVISFDVKPVPGDWNGAGCHTNYSTKSMRADGGMKKIIEGIKKMKQRHKEHMKLYGKGNQKRLTGKHETQSYKTFSYGVADRGASIRIPRQCDIDGKGYFEDRRPGANMDPYDVTSMIAETTILYELKDEKDLKNNNNNNNNDNDDDEIIYIPQ